MTRKVDSPAAQRVTIPDAVREVLLPLIDDFTQAAAIKYKGKQVQFKLKPREQLYLYWKGKSGTLYCYTPHPSTDGDYFTWNYVPLKGSHLMMAYEMKRLVRSAKRKVAGARALARYKKDFPNAHDSTSK